MLSESSRSHLVVPSYPPPTNNYTDGSTLTSGFSIDRPMFSDSTTVTSGEYSVGPSGHAVHYNQQGFAAAPQGQQMALKEYSQKTSSESNASTYI